MSAEDAPFERVWYRIVEYLDRLDTAARPAARRRLIGRLKHPELGGNPQASSNVHPKQMGGTAASSGGPMCVCGAPRRSHDIDGQRRDCDGYVEEK